MILDSKKTVSLLVQHHDIMPPSEVVGQVLGSIKKCDGKYFLYLYLHSLFEVDSNAGKEFHDLQVTHCFLYDEYSEYIDYIM